MIDDFSGDSLLRSTLKKLAIEAGGTKQCLVSRVGIRVMDSETIRQLGAKAPAAGTLPLQNRDGTMNR